MGSSRRTSCYIYDDLYSFFHTILGIVARVLAYYNSIAALALLTIFVVYEVFEDRYNREVGRAKCDILEFMIGYVGGEILFG